MGGERIGRWQHLFHRVAGGSRACFLTLALCVALVTGAAAQDTPNDLAAVLEITFGTVEVQRAETDQWLALTPGAVAPFGPGDSLRTDDTGRALLTLPEADGEVLLLPGSQVTLSEYVNPAQPTLNARLVQGVLVGRFGPSTDRTGEFTVGETTATFEADGATFLASERFRASVLVVDDGQVTVGGAQTFGAGEGLLVDNEAFNTFADLPEATSAATIIGLARGCPARIRTATGRNLNARTGPGTGNIQIGQFPDGAAVRVMGVVASGGWYRVQFQAGFGWVERLALEIADIDACDLPILPDDAFDIPRNILGVTEREFALLEPFYGTPRQDPNFYRPEPILAE